MKTLLLYVSLLCGFLIPQGHQYSFLIRYLLMLLLFFAFLDVKINIRILHVKHFLLLLCNLTIPLAVFFVAEPYSSSIANTAFITALAPTAIAAPVIISLLKGKVEFVAVSLLVTNIIIALFVPFLVPALLNTGIEISTVDILIPVLSVLFIPLITAQILKIMIPKFHSFLKRYKDHSFYLLMGGIYLGTSKASNFIYNEMTASISMVFIIAFISMLLCIINFSVGRLVGGKNLALESGQSLGQKNNAFTIWLSVTFINPLAVLGPVFYVLWQNIFISWQLFKRK
jgi:BASS family bile acid:Na+ symporter